MRRVSLVFGRIYTCWVSTFSQFCKMQRGNRWLKCAWYCFQKPTTMNSNEEHYNNCTQLRLCCTFKSIKVFVGEATKLIMTYGHTYDARRGKRVRLSRAFSHARSLRAVYDLPSVWFSYFGLGQNGSRLKMRLSWIVTHRQWTDYLSEK